MFEVINSESELHSLIKAEDFVLVRGVNSTEIVGQVAFDLSCIYLSLTDTELSRILLHPKLIIKRIGSLKDIIEKYPISFKVVKESISLSKKEEVKKYESDSLFPIKAIYKLLADNSLIDQVEIENIIQENCQKALDSAVQEEVLVADMHYMLSQYIFQRPRPEMDFNK